MVVIFSLLATLSTSLRAADAADEPDEAKALLKVFEGEGDTTNSLGGVMVRVPAGYRVAKTEVTQAQYQEILGQNPSKFRGTSRPVESVSPNEAKAFCGRLTEREQKAGQLPKGFAYDLPSEREFDTYVANTPLETAFVSHVGDRRETAPVASLPPNPLGLFDVRGNVWEWCQGAVARGASYQSHEDYLAPGFRFVGNPDMRVMDIGFRIVLRQTGR